MVCPVNQRGFRQRIGKAPEKFSISMILKVCTAPGSISAQMLL